MELKKVKARVEHSCSICDRVIPINAFYYKENKFLKDLHYKEQFCTECYNQYGDHVLFVSKEKIKKIN